MHGTCRCGDVDSWLTYVSRESKQPGSHSGGVSATRCVDFGVLPITRPRYLWRGASVVAPSTAAFTCCHQTWSCSVFRGIRTARCVWNCLVTPQLCSFWMGKVWECMGKWSFNPLEWRYHIRQTHLRRLSGGWGPKYAKDIRDHPLLPWYPSSLGVNKNWERTESNGF